MTPIATVADLEPSFDLAIVGAGPAGMSAATTAAALGIRVVLFDENAAPGGQIYRSLGMSTASRRQLLGTDYQKAEGIIRALEASTVAYMPAAAVWMVSRALEIGISKSGSARIIRARHIILATGASERPFPIAGWTLPGVMTGGAAQGLLKSSGLVPQGRTVLAGTGPLLWQLASQLIAADAPPVALLDTTGFAQRFAAFSHVPDFLRSPYFLKGLRLVREVRRATKVISGITALAAHGEGGFAEVSYRCGTGASETIKADCLLLHQGVIPSVNLASAAGCDIVWEEDQACWKPQTDAWGRASDGISIAGDGAGIGGAEIAARRGQLCGLDAAYHLGRLDEAGRDRAAAPVRAEISRYARGRKFIDLAFRPDRSFRVAPPEALACRCEEVTGAQIGEALSRLGDDVGPDQLKSFLRCGMGPCQGRMCGPTISEMIAAHRGVSPAAVGYFRLRYPVKPITVTEVASLQAAPAASTPV